nr:uncharacterized protein LOC129281497 [Lytechinus pictus]
MAPMAVREASVDRMKSVEKSGYASRGGLARALLSVSKESSHSSVQVNFVPLWVDANSAATCTYDSDCSDDKLCCESGAGYVCTIHSGNNDSPGICQQDGTGCTEDGLYLPKQCDRENGMCWCASQCGYPQPSTYSDGVFSCAAENPPCHKEIAELSPVGGPVLPGSFRPRCVIDGFFNSTQCLGSVCWCVDRCGKRFQGSEHHVSAVSSSDCALRWRCGGDPCESATCEPYPQATCRVEERCGKCLPVFNIGDQDVSCLQGSHKVEKAGVCPSSSSIQVGRGFFVCRQDADCFGDDKCCWNGAGLVCTDPIPKTHEGQCPIPWLSECLSHHRTDLCQVDSQCARSEKCCESGCGKACRRISDQVNVSDYYCLYLLVK